MAYKNKSKSQTLTLGVRKTMRQNREESKSIPKAPARDKPHGEEIKKKKNQKPKQREEIKQVFGLYFQTTIFSF